MKPMTSAVNQRTLPERSTHLSQAISIPLNSWMQATKATKCCLILMNLCLMTTFLFHVVRCEAHRWRLGDSQSVSLLQYFVVQYCK